MVLLLGLLYGIFQEGLPVDKLSCLFGLIEERSLAGVDSIAIFVLGQDIFKECLE